MTGRRSVKNGTGRGQDLQQGCMPTGRRRAMASWSHGVVASRPGPVQRKRMAASDARSWEDVTQVS
jgi:hypothetical protein